MNKCRRRVELSVVAVGAIMTAIVLVFLLQRPDLWWLLVVTSVVVSGLAYVTGRVVIP